MIESLFANNSVALAAATIGLAAAAALISFIYRSVTRRRLQMPRNGRPRPVRLGVVDVFRLDGKRQLVIVRRDSVEHLIMIGGPNDLLIESQITRSEKRDSRNYREAKVRDNDVRDWEPREPVLPRAGDLSPSPADEDVPIYSRHTEASPAPAEEEEAALSTETREDARSKLDSVFHQERRHGKVYGGYDDAGTRGPLPAYEPATDIATAKSKPRSFAGHGRPPSNRERPTLRPLAERQAQSGASPPASVLRAPQAPAGGSQELQPQDSKEITAAAQAGKERQASHSLSGGPRTAPLTAGDGAQTADSLAQEIARILGRERP